LKLNGTHQLLAYADDFNILGGSVHTVKENAKTLVFATKEIAVEVNADKNIYSHVSCEKICIFSYFIHYTGQQGFWPMRKNVCF
jgi:hypothetical protein